MANKNAISGTDQNFGIQGLKESNNQNYSKFYENFKMVDLAKNAVSVMVKDRVKWTPKRVDLEKVRDRAKWTKIWD